MRVYFPELSEGVNDYYEVLKSVLFTPQEHWFIDAFSSVLEYRIRFNSNQRERPLIEALSQKDREIAALVTLSSFERRFQVLYSELHFLRSVSTAQAQSSAAQSSRLLLGAMSRRKRNQRQVSIESSLI